MKTLWKNLLLAYVLTLLVTQTYAQQDLPEISVVGNHHAESFPLVHDGIAVPILYDPEDASVVKIATAAFQKDVKRVTGVSPELKSNQNAVGDYVVMVGTLGQSSLITEMADAGKVDASSIEGQWETFSITLIDEPLPHVKKGLLIMGSDPRGTAYGVFELSKLIGVSPWYWWADVPIQTQENLYVLSGTHVVGPPSVKYRGIFLNDEDWGLQPWAAQNIDTVVQDIGPHTYAKIFELLLRLKANLIWPAMHPSTKAFFHYPENAQVASAYNIVVGTSHAEPMLRNNVDEWDLEKMGDFNYMTNAETIYQYWTERAKESKGLEAIYTVGIRGVHDSGMRGVKDMGEAATLLENVIADQRTILREMVDTDISALPQAFTAYKEVLDIYDQGLELPDDITLVWPDDNYGYIKRLSNPEEQLRTGGSGVYYHASYWGRPHDYLWLGTTHPALIREEMWKAYQMKASNLWVLNVGDIKPTEYAISMFLDMAYDITPFDDSRYVKDHHLSWIEEAFGNKAKEIEGILWEYYDLAFERKPEFMGWSRTEPTTQTTLTGYNHFFYGDEAQKRIERYEFLERKVENIRHQLKPEEDDPFYQLVYYPVIGASMMNKKFLYRDKAEYYARQNRASAQDYALLAKQAYERIQQETNYYNTQLSDGKWNGMMSMEPRSLPVFHEVSFLPMALQPLDKLGVMPEGLVHKDSSLLQADSKRLFLPSFSPWGPSKQFIDIYLQSDKPVRWKVDRSDHWIQVSAMKGILKPEFGQKEERLWVSIDWNKAPKGKALNGYVTIKDGRNVTRVDVSANPSPSAELAQEGLFIEHNGYISIFAENYSKKNDQPETLWQEIDGLGHTGKSLMALPIQANSLVDTSTILAQPPSLSYDFYLLHDAEPIVNVFCLPTHPITAMQKMRFAIAIDDGPLTIVDFQTYGRSDEWKENVLRNSAVAKWNSPHLPKGKHTMHIYMVDPGVVLDRIVMDLGGLQKAYSVIPETKGDK